MKSYPIILVILFSLCVFSCKDNLTDIGTGIQPISDRIQIATDTFHLMSENVTVSSIISKPDSFLLGTYSNSKFGSTYAEILAQLNCPVGFIFPPTAVADSASIVLGFYTSFGYKKSPMRVNIYEMNKKTFDYSGIYHTDINPTEYVDKSSSNFLSSRIFKADDAKTLKSDSNSIKFPLSAEFVQRFFKNTDFSSTANFLNDFKGLYITTDYGSASLLNVSSIYIDYYYHHTYQATKINGGDSLVTVNTFKVFIANPEVRQVNRIVHPDQATVPVPDAGVNYIASPSAWDTRVGIPLNKIQQRINDSIQSKRPNLNSAVIKVEATNIAVDTTKAPTTNYMLLIKESAYENFFKNNELPSDTCAILAAHKVSLVANTTDVYEDYYSFDCARLIANELKIAQTKKEAPADWLNMRLVPVQVAFNSSSAVTSVKQDNLMSAVSIRSAKNTDSPLRLKMIFSGF